MKNGIDVSRHQLTIDWIAVKNSGIEFAIIKAGGSDDGFYEDSTFQRNYAGAKGAGLAVGAYYIVGSKCISREDGIADAKRFLRIIEGKQFEFPVYIDLEKTAPEHKTGATDACIGFCQTMEQAGYYCGIYASDVYGFAERLDISRLAAFDKWVARYGSKPQYVKTYGVWQKSDVGRVSGITEKVDLDESYMDYPSIIKGKGLNGFSKPEPVQQSEPVKAHTVHHLKVIIDGVPIIDDHEFSGLLGD
ncbi:glycoside hydrolase family 25 protein [Ruminococcus flavefaciens]|uniref:Glycosyl hydrolase family 25 n=1 Tax=Ruminococcus flavefaciens TaxID=1265 RepID=A0A315Y1X6_RUMFL|nr:glycoside hydrolase family 25 protein [Ruminococcus flavefaciens]PWJ14017.1 glycosyl hydrolase family 25 [Ruminococcus flavefaciens]SSA43635.1 Glycosyl hydrolases family 25 [Ruminococcus flavefaciens]